jgi:hypothetical protein
MAMTFIDDADKQEGENFQKVPKGDSTAFL